MSGVTELVIQCRGCSGSNVPSSTKLYGFATSCYRSHHFAAFWRVGKVATQYCDLKTCTCNMICNSRERGVKIPPSVCVSFPCCHVNKQSVILSSTSDLMAWLFIHSALSCGLSQQLCFIFPWGGDACALFLLLSLNIKIK